MLDADGGSPAEVAASLVDLKHINDWFGGTRTTIDLLLRTDPETRGAVNFDTVRTLAISPLAVDFEVIPDDRIVWVLSVWTPV